MEKLDFVKKVETVRQKMPKSVIPIFVLRFPEYNTVKKRSRIQNVLSGRVVDVEILNKLEELAKFFDNGSE